MPRDRLLALWTVTEVLFTIPQYTGCHMGYTITGPKYPPPQSQRQKVVSNRQKPRIPHVGVLRMNPTIKTLL